MRSLWTASWLVSAVLLWGCGGEGGGHDHDGHDHGQDHSEHDGSGHDEDHEGDSHGEDGDGDGDGGHDDHAGHVHAAQNGGQLVILGDTLAHAEVKWEPETGVLDVWILGSHAEQFVRVAQTSLTVQIEPDEGESFELELPAIANPLTGETVGDSAQFTLTDPRLKGLGDWNGVLERLVVKGSTFENVEFGISAEG